MTSLPIRYIAPLPQKLRDELNAFRAECEHFVNTTEDPAPDLNYVEAVLGEIVSQAQKLKGAVKAAPGYERDAWDA